MKKSETKTLESKLKELKSQLDAIDSQRDKIVEEYLEIRSSLSTKRISEIVGTDITKLNSDNIKDLKITHDMYFKLTPSVLEGVDYTKHRCFLDHMDKFLYDNHLASTSYDPDIDQKSICVEYDQNIPFDQQYQKQIEFFKYLKFQENYDEDSKFKKLGIIESTLSEHGTFSILVFEDDTCKLQITIYGSTRDLVHFDSIKDCLLYVYEHHPYKEREIKKTK